MTALELFTALAPVAGPVVERAWGRRDLCIYTARMVLNVFDYFGVPARELPVRVMLMNAAFRRNIDAGAQTSEEILAGEAYSVGVGFGTPPRENAWDGHLIVVSGEWFGDFAIQQAERQHKQIFTGTAVVSPYRGDPRWMVENATGTVIEYEQIEDRRYLQSPDWRDRARHRDLAAALIRQIRKQLAAATN